jgi:hypothetical protein
VRHGEEVGPGHHGEKRIRSAISPERVDEGPADQDVEHRSRKLERNYCERDRQQHGRQRVGNSTGVQRVRIVAPHQAGGRVVQEVEVGGPVWYREIQQRPAGQHEGEREHEKQDPLALRGGFHAVRFGLRSR